MAHRTAALDQEDGVIVVDCLYEECEGVVEFDVRRDSDDGGAAHGLHSNSWSVAEPKSDSCTEGCEFEDWQWEQLQAAADGHLDKGDY